MDLQEVLLTAPDHAVLWSSTRSGVTSTRFGTRDVRDLSDGALPVRVVRVDVDETTGEVDDREGFNVRTAKQVKKRVGELSHGWIFGVRSHIEIRNGPR